MLHITLIVQYKVYIMQDMYSCIPYVTVMWEIH